MVDILSFLGRTRIDTSQAHYILAVSDLKMCIFRGQRQTQPLVALLTVGLGAILGIGNPCRVLIV